MSESTIITKFYAPPIPVRNLDWTAYRAEDEDRFDDPDAYDGVEFIYHAPPTGHGATEQEAIADLKERLEEL